MEDIIGLLQKMVRLIAFDLTVCEILWINIRKISDTKGIPKPCIFKR